MKKFYLLLLMLIFSSRAWGYSSDGLVTSLDAASSAPASADLVPVMLDGEATLKKMTFGTMMTNYPTNTSLVTSLNSYATTTAMVTSIDATMATVVAGYQPLESTLTDIADGTITENLVNTANPWADNEVSDTLTCSIVSDADKGDITISSGAWAVENDSHTHTATSISGLGSADFTSASVSQWGNDAGYITSSQNATGITGDLDPDQLSGDTSDDNSVDGKIVGTVTLATKANALAVDGTDCSAGQAPLGIDASGNATGCWTPTGGGGGSVSPTITFSGNTSIFVGNLQATSGLASVQSVSVSGNSTFTGTISVGGVTANSTSINDISKVTAGSNPGHTHTGASISALSTTNFTSANVSNFSNDVHYLKDITASQGLLRTGESVGLIVCSNGQIMKNSGGTSWGCAADSTGGSPTFDAIASGTNTNANMIMGSGSTLNASASSVSLPTISVGTWNANATTITFISAPSVNNTGSGGVYLGIAGETLNAGDLLYQKIDWKYYKAKADNAATLPAIAVAYTAASSNGTFTLIKDGFYRNDAWAFTTSTVLFASASTAGAVTWIAPTTTAQFIQIVGHSVGTGTMGLEFNSSIVERK